jgi:hypothetical protein
MKVISNFSKNYNEDPIRFFEFEQYEDQSNDIDLFIGAYPDDSIFEKNNRKKIFFSTEEQTWDNDSTDKYLNNVEKILTICPPNITNRQKRQFVFFPFNKNLIPKQNEKIYDAIYTGYANGPHVEIILNSIKKFNYRYVSFSNIPGLTTDSGVDYVKKLNLISESKCCVVHNLVSNGTPQLKSRPFEAAFCKSLMLVYKDNFNIIEDWFTPNEDFLYFNNENQLIEIISDASVNYEKYEKIISNAFEKSVNEYTTEKFIEKYIGLK